MREESLVIPIVLDPHEADLETNSLYVEPTHVASWIIDAEAGPSRYTALASVDNSIWIHPSPIHSEIDITQSQTPQIAIPTIYTPVATSPASPPFTNKRNKNTSRPRATSSSASSILTTSSRRRVTPFSPPSISRQLPTASLTSTTAIADHSSHEHKPSLSDQELLSHLREQQNGPVEDKGYGLGLGIAGIGRRGLPGVHGKEDGESSHAHSGAGSPRSSHSGESGGGGALSSVLRVFSRGGDEEKDKEGLKSMIEEVEVEREMEREKREEDKELEDLKILEAIGKTTAKRKSKRSADVEGQSKMARKVIRIVLHGGGKGKVVCMRAFTELGVLCVLRDIGILDIISISSLSLVSTMQLEESEKLESSSMPSSSKTPLRLPPFWLWKDVEVSTKGDTALIAVHGIPWPCGMPSPNGEVTRVVLLSQLVDKIWAISARLELPGEGHVAVCNTESESYLLHSTPTSLTSYPIVYSSSTPYPSAPPSRSQTPAPRSVSSTTTSPRPDHALRRNASTTSLRDVDQPKDKDRGFAKFLAVRRNRGVEEVVKDDKPGIGEGKEVERDGGGAWREVYIDEDGQGIGLADDAIDVFACDGKSLSIKGNITLDNKQRVNQAVYLARSQRIVIATERETLVYRQRDTSSVSSRFSLEKSYPQSHAISRGGSREIIFLQGTTVESLDTSDAGLSKIEILSIAVPLKKTAITAIVPVDLQHILTSDVNGNVTKSKISAVLSGQSEDHAASDGPDVDRLDSPVTCLRLLCTGKYVVAGDEDGTLRIWTSEPFVMLGSFSLFADPLEDIVYLDQPQAGALRGCILCTSRAGTVALISLKELELLYLIPASRAPLRRVFLGGKDILLAYANGKARVWNTERCEFRRSTGLDAGEDMLSSGDWAEVLLESDAGDNTAIGAASGCKTESDLARTFNIDLRAVSQWLAALTGTASPLATLRNLLSLVLPLGIDPAIDEICVSGLGIARPILEISMGLTATSGENIFTSGNTPWNVSARATGLRQLAIVTLLRPFLDSPDHERSAAQVIAHYTTSLPPSAIDADLDFFAAFYLDSATDVHQAARLLFAARLGRMSESEIEAVVDANQPQLPSSVAQSARHGQEAARALTVIGGMTLHRYQSISPSALKLAADSLVTYLQDSSSPHIPLAIEITSKGFPTWQTYLDPMDLLRHLFRLSTLPNTPQTSPALTHTSIPALGRLAVLHVATSYPALFMSTLSMDILDAKTVEGRKSIMKLCVYMARKKPGVLEAGLPRIAESVVKSLDPNIGTMRDDVWEAATVILNELVLAFSTIDFHSGTQRLAVGTSEGAVIMYDLKTAFRLYILEPHKTAVSSVNFSPDGRRVVTVSLSDGDVTIWKVGSSLSGFFNVGGPPRQGGVAGEPFKRIGFFRGDNGPMKETSALSDIKVEWPGSRKARVMIRETALTFET